MESGVRGRRRGLFHEAWEVRRDNRYAPLIPPTPQVTEADYEALNIHERECDDLCDLLCSTSVLFFPHAMRHDDDAPSYSDDLPSLRSHGPAAAVRAHQPRSSGAPTSRPTSSIRAHL